MLLEQRPRSTHRQRIDDRFAHQSSFHFSVWPKATAQQAEGEKKVIQWWQIVEKIELMIFSLLLPFTFGDSHRLRQSRLRRDKPIYPAPAVKSQMETTPPLDFSPSASSPKVRSLHLRRRQSRSRREKTSSLLGKRRPPAPFHLW